MSTPKPAIPSKPPVISPLPHISNTKPTPMSPPNRAADPSRVFPGSPSVSNMPFDTKAMPKAPQTMPYDTKARTKAPMPLKGTP
jgi:hypothetical protein